MHKEVLIQKNSFLVYRIGADLFASNSDEVRNILEVSMVIKDKDAGSQFINNNGNKIPIYEIAEDLSIAQNRDINSSVLVLEMSNIKLMAGFVVDEVISLVDIKQENLIEIPRIGNKYRLEYIDRIAKINEKIIRILNIQNIITRNVNLLKSSNLKQKQIVFQ